MGHPVIFYICSSHEHLCAGGEKGMDWCGVSRSIVCWIKKFINVKFDHLPLQGDTGGPLVARDGDLAPYMLVGVVSVGTTRCGVGAPAFFTRVSSFRQWIVDNLK